MQVCHGRETWSLVMKRLARSRHHPRTCRTPNWPSARARGRVPRLTRGSRPNLTFPFVGVGAGMSVSYLPPQSLTLRANLANAVSPLRRARSKTPFFRLPAHRIPTLWGLYRGLLRDAPNETVCFHYTWVG